MTYLPEGLEQSTISDIIEGETVYVAPRAMYADKSGKLWLNGNYSFSKESFGTAKMAVSRSNGRYVVDISGCRDEGWSRDGGGFVGGSKPLPVSKLVGG